MLPRPIPLLLAVLCGLLIAPLLTLQAYWFNLPEAFRAHFPTGFIDLISLAACSLSFLLYPLIGLAYTLLDRKNRCKLTPKIIGASLAALLVAIAQFLLGQFTAHTLGVDPSGEGSAVLDFMQGFFGPYVMIFFIAIGAVMAALILSALASIPVLLYELVIRPKQESRRSVLNT